MKNLLGKAWIGFLIAGCLADTNATPPEYVTFGRQQTVQHTIDPDRLLRIWIVYVDQGDGIFIQLPTALAGALDGAHESESERFDVLIDGGANPESNAHLISDFLQEVYGADGGHIDLAVVSHHDQDHVAGLTNLLSSDSFSFGRIVHNGLASYRPGSRGVPMSGTYQGVADGTKTKITRGMGAVETSAQGQVIKDEFIISSFDELKTEFDSHHLQGVYEDLARAAVKAQQDGRLGSFDRAKAGETLVDETDDDGTNLRLVTLWPEDRLRAYGSKNWGQTINGNSVTLRLEYGDFSVLLTGDHNEHSEQAWLDTLGNNRSLLECDVLKVPHHGSNHALEEFFQPQNSPLAVISVASLGERGFGQSWKHPSTEVIRWCGGPHRFYTTFTHERAFSWSNLGTAARDQMIERSHILIETDGSWFRVVEIPIDDFDVNQVPLVTEVDRGNGTRWIKAN